jgi:hypothetical protein
MIAMGDIIYELFYGNNFTIITTTITHMKTYYIVANTKEEKEKAFDIFKKAGYKYLENYHPNNSIICTDSDGNVYNSAVTDEEWHIEN